VSPELVNKLVCNPEQPIEDIKRIVYNQNLKAVEDAVLAEAMRVQHYDQTRMQACMRVLHRIQVAGIGGEDAGG
jgi:hypothetical protein